MLNTKSIYDLIIVGGGAAGFFAAGNLTQGIKMLILERSDHPLAKVRISGGGRCNLTNACFDPWRLVEFYPRGAEELRGAFTRFQPWDTMRWFEAHGVPLKIDDDGRVFPESNEAQDIVDCLIYAARSAGSELWQQADVKKIQLLPQNNQARFQVHVHRQDKNKPIHRKTSEDVKLLAHHIILATGGEANGFTLAADLGHSIVPPVPSLFTFKINDSRLEGLAGLSVPQARIRLLPLGEDTGYFEQVGALLITHWGVSGPTILRSSAWGARWLHERNYHASVEINWLYPSSLEQTLTILHNYKTKPANRQRTVLAHGPFPALPERLWRRFVSFSNILDTEQWSNLSKVKLLRLAQSLCSGRYEIQGKGPFKDEFVTCGGVELSEVDFQTMQSRRIPGLYFAGEVLNIDGVTGGFNFQNAWTTAHIAIQAIQKNSTTQRI